MNTHTTAATNVTAMLAISALEVDERLAALNDYLADNGQGPFTIAWLDTPQTGTVLAMADLNGVTEDDQLDLLDFICEMPWQFPDDARVTLRPATAALLH